MEVLMNDSSPKKKKHTHTHSIHNMTAVDGAK